MNRMWMPLIAMVLVFGPVCQGGTARAQSEALLRGIEQYRRDNYEEAAEILAAARKAEPQSTTVAFFLGLTYKQIDRYPEAAEHLRAAVTMTPRIKEALTELIEVLARLGGPDRLAEARQWIDVAEKEGIFPAKTRFLLGMVLSKQGEHEAAIAAFEQAKALDADLAQSAELQIGVSQVKLRRLDRAQESFRAALQQDPESDLASFARQYIDVVDRQKERERVLRVTLGVFGRYDTNLIQDPHDPPPAIAAALGTEQDAESGTLDTNLRVNYTPVLSGNWLLTAQWAVSGSLHDTHATSHDSLSNGFYLAPGYNFGRTAVNLVLNYNHHLSRSPGWRRNSEYFSAGPMVRFLVTPQHLLDIYGGWDVNEYKPALREEEDRDAAGPRAYLSWMWLFAANSLFNLKYEYADSDTDGAWWDNDSHRFSLNAAVPLSDRVTAQAGAQATLTDYKNVHTVFNQLREDEIYYGFFGLNFDLTRNLKLIGQYSHTTANSNIAIYDYRRDVYSVGLEYRY